MRRLVTAAAAVLLPIGLAAGPTAAAPHDPPDTPAAGTARSVAQGPDDICDYTKRRPNLHIGSAGSAVQQTQCYLNQAIGAGLDEDGDFGPQTRAATRTFQQCAGIVVDGLIGAQTWSFLSFWANDPAAPFC